MNSMFQKAVAVLALGGMCWAQTAPASGTKTTTTKTTTKTRTRAVSKSTSAAEPKPAAAASTTTREELQELKQMLLQQQQQINQLQQQMAARDQQLQQTQQQLQQAQAAAGDAQQKAAAAQSTADDAKSAKAEVESVKDTLASTITTIQDDQKKMSAMGSPEKIHYKGITLTPGGFIAAETTFRNHTEQNDVISSFNGIPYNGDPRTKLTEFRGTARQSRLSLLAEGTAGNTKLSAYYEMDFLGGAPTANENQSTSFTPRQRQLWAQAALNNGWTFTAGQTWSLFTMSKKDDMPRGEWVPATVDGQYVVGYNFARLWTARVSKNFANKKATVSLSAENPAFLVTGSVPALVSGVPGGVLSAGTGSLGNGNNYTTGVVPDLVTKVSFNPGWGHYEVKGLFRTFRDHFLGTTNNAKDFGAALGFGAILPVVKSKVDVIAQGSFGKGNSRYIDSGNADFYIRPDGAMEMVHASNALVGIETHPTPKLDWYVYGGTEYQQRSWAIESGTTYGYGPSNANYSKCLAGEATFSCGAPFKNLSQFATGFWYRFYKGQMGTLQYGMQYSYTKKIGWWGLNGAAGSPSLTPNGDEHMIFTSFRYYIP